MPSARLTIPAAAEHARTARLVAGVAARRAGVAEEVLDDVRLAVAEAVASAVHRAGAEASGGPRPEVTIEYADDGTGFSVAITDRIPVMTVADDAAELSLPLIRALAPDSDSYRNEWGGRTVRLSWPVAAPA